ncbi:hypothetical protein [Anaerosporobacter sp.]|nr:hypothetical protein [Anaerosporobacter sp.]
MIKINNEMMKYILLMDSNKKSVIEKKVKMFLKKVCSKIKIVDDCIIVMD